MPEVSVIVPTTALATRREILWRAIQSLLDQERCRVIPIVVINGPLRDRGLTEDLSSDSRLRVTVLEEASLPGAYRAGRALVNTPWFTELDDDDLILPGAIHARIEALGRAPDHDVVITNGISRSGDGIVLHIKDMDRIKRDPLAALMKGNWLLAGSWLAKTSSVPSDFFGLMPPYRETTYLALRFAMQHRLLFVDEATVECHTDTLGSVSKSREYVLGGAAAMESLLRLDLPPAVRSWIRENRAGSLHETSELLLREGALRQAWAMHFQSLLEVRGWRYLPFTRRLLYSAFLANHSRDGGAA